MKTHKMFLVSGLIAAVFLLLSFLGISKTPKAEAIGKKEWTFMVYMAGDNNLSNLIKLDIDKMEKVGGEKLGNSPKNLNIIVQADTAGMQPHSSFRQKVERGSPQNFIPEVNTGDPKTLSDFITFAVKEYPAENYGLIIWGHGDGWRGVAMDASADDGKGTKNDDWLSIDELTTALQASKNDFDKFKIIGFNACLMAEVEVAYQLQNFSDILIASQDCISGTTDADSIPLGAGIELVVSFPYGEIFSNINENPGKLPREIAADIVNQFSQYYQRAIGSSKDYYTLSAIDLTKINDLMTNLNELAIGLSNAVENKEQLFVSKARSLTHEPTGGCCLDKDGKPKRDDVVDLGDITRIIHEDRRISPQYREKAPIIEQMLTNPDEVVIANRVGRKHVSGDKTLANGLSIYFPKAQSVSIKDKDKLRNHKFFDQGSDPIGTLYAKNPDKHMPDLPDDHPKPVQSGFDFTKDEANKWDEFLYRYYSPVADAGPDKVGIVGQWFIIDGSMSTDIDEKDGSLTPVNYIWDLDLIKNIPEPVVPFRNAAHKKESNWDIDNDNENDDDKDMEGPVFSYRCPLTPPGGIDLRLMVWDDHNTLGEKHTALDHFNVDDDIVNIKCTEVGPIIGGSTIPVYGYFSDNFTRDYPTGPAENGWTAYGAGAQIIDGRLATFSYNIYNPPGGVYRTLPINPSFNSFNFGFTYVGGDSENALNFIVNAANPPVGGVVTGALYYLLVDWTGSNSGRLCVYSIHNGASYCQQSSVSPSNMDLLDIAGRVNADMTSEVTLSVNGGNPETFSFPAMCDPNILSECNVTSGPYLVLGSNVGSSDYSRDYFDNFYLNWSANLTVNEAIEYLDQQITQIGLPDGLTNSLTTKLSSALASLAPSPSLASTHSAINELTSFMYEIDAQFKAGNVTSVQVASVGTIVDWIQSVLNDIINPPPPS